MCFGSIDAREGPGEVEGDDEEFIVRTAWDVWMTQIGLLMIVVADPATKPASMDSRVPSPLPAERKFELRSIPRERS